MGAGVMNIMMRRSISLLAVAAILVTNVAIASTSVAQGPPDGFSLPPQAQEVAPGVWFLGTGVDNGLPVVGYAYEHHRDGHDGGPGGGGGNDGGEDPPSDASSCYSFIANGAHWQSPEAVTVDASNPVGATFGDIEAWMRTWEDHASGIYGAFGAGSNLTADTSSTDGSNEVYFDEIADAGVLGFTIVWSSRIGPPTSRPIVEADMVVDPNWNWWIGTEGDGTIGADQLDLAAVFAHEAGHYVGLGHTDATGCEAQTMYPSLSSGDDTKQSLDVGDTAGVIDLYN